jgi:transglutaminase-like putative cysteine protease
MMLRPRDSNDQRLLDATLDIEPRPQNVRWIHDVFDNCVAIANFAGNTRSLRVESNIALEHTPFEGPEVLLEDRARYYPFSYDGEEMPDLARSIERHYADPSGELDHWVQRFLRQGRPTETGTLLMTLTYAIKEGLSYERRAARGTQSPLQTLASRRGSCRDFATLMMEAARALGFAARFVSGYLYVPERDSGERYLGSGSTHAWCQIYLPGAGWVEFDPTNGIVGNRDLIRVAVAQPPFAVEPEPNGPNLLRLQRALGANHPAHVPRTPIFGRRIILRVPHSLLLFRPPSARRRTRRWAFDP